MKWICLEPHTHTVHSDAGFTVSDLLSAAKRAQLNAIILTDHNTDTGMDEISPDQIDPRVVPGIEWTTFYGHVVIIAPERFVEWRDLTVNNLDPHLRLVHEANAVVQMAHPFQPGEPFCCGCHWDFDIPDWTQIDAVEVWSKGDPAWSPWNEKAYQLWKDKWKEGYRPMAVTARDWHEERDPATVFGVNYLYIDETKPFSEAVKEAYRRKRGYMTAGPVLSLTVQNSSGNYGIGDTITEGDTVFRIMLDQHQRTEVWEPYELVPEQIHLINNDEVRIFEFPGYGIPLETDLELREGFVFLEVHGKAHQRPCKLLMTNPLIIRQ